MHQHDVRKTKALVDDIRVYVTGQSLCDDRSADTASLREHAAESRARLAVVKGARLNAVPPDRATALHAIAHALAASGFCDADAGVPALIVRLLAAVRAAAQWGLHAKAVLAHIGKGCNAMPEALTAAYETALTSAVSAEFGVDIIFARDVPSARGAADRIVAQAAAVRSTAGSVATEIAVVAAGAGRYYALTAQSARRVTLPPIRNIGQTDAPAKTPLRVLKAEGKARILAIDRLRRDPNNEHNLERSDEIEAAAALAKDARDAHFKENMRAARAAAAAAGPPLRTGPEAPPPPHSRQGSTHLPPPGNTRSEKSLLFGHLMGTRDERSLHQRIIVDHADNLSTSLPLAVDILSLAVLAYFRGEYPAPPMLADSHSNTAFFQAMSVGRKQLMNPDAAIVAAYASLGFPPLPGHARDGTFTPSRAPRIKGDYDPMKYANNQTNTNFFLRFSADGMHGLRRRLYKNLVAWVLRTDRSLSAGKPVFALVDALLDVIAGVNRRRVLNPDWVVGTEYPPKWLLVPYDSPAMLDKALQGKDFSAAIRALVPRLQAKVLSWLNDAQDDPHAERVDPTAEVVRTDSFSCLQQRPIRALRVIWSLDRENAAWIAELPERSMKRRVEQMVDGVVGARRADEGEDDDDDDEDDDDDDDDDDDVDDDDDPEYAGPIFVGKRYYPKMNGLMPKMRNRRRHITLTSQFTRQVFKLDLHEVFELHRPRGADGLWYNGVSVVTNGTDFIQKFERDKANVQPRPPMQAAQRRRMPGEAPATPHPPVGATPGAPPAAQTPTWRSQQRVPPPRRVAGSSTEHCPWLRVISVDPGCTNIVYAFEELPGGGERVWRLTRDEWRARTHADRRLKRTMTWTKGLRAKDGAYEQLLALGGAAANQSTGVAFARYVRAVEALRPVIFAETLKSRWADEQFRAYQAGKRELMSFWARVRAGRIDDGTAGVFPVVGFGEATIKPSGRGRMSTPTTAMYKACVTVMGAGAVVLTTEHRSTKCCAGCGNILQLVYAPISAAQRREHDEALVAAAAGRRPPPRPLPSYRKVRGLLRCDHVGCCYSGMFLDRDRNAARNILHAFLAVDRGADLPRHMRFASEDDERHDRVPPHFRLRPKKHDGEAAGVAGHGSRAFADKAKRRAAAARAQLQNFNNGAKAPGVGMPIWANPCAEASLPMEVATSPFRLAV